MTSGAGGGGTTTGGSAGSAGQAGSAGSSGPGGSGGTGGSAGGGATITGLRYTVQNSLALPREGELIELPFAEVSAALGGAAAENLVVHELSGPELASQALDSNQDLTWDVLLVRVDLAASETKTIEITTGAPAVVAQQVHARFVPERLDDFAWENDRTIQRLYGPAQETAPGQVQCSGVDVWVKNTPELVMDDWYALDDYHVDHGQGLDGFTITGTLGAGGVAVWQNPTLHASKNFESWKLIADGPLRAVFELSYDAWDAGGASVSEVKRVTLDAGSQLSRMESTITVAGGGSITLAAGLALGAGASATIAPDQTWATAWRALDGDNGWLGMALVPISAVTLEQASDHVLGSASVASGEALAYYSGGGWSKGGFADNAAWDAYVQDFAAKVGSPLLVSPAP